MNPGCKSLQRGLCGAGLGDRETIGHGPEVVRARASTLRRPRLGKRREPRRRRAPVSSASTRPRFRGIGALGREVRGPWRPPCPARRRGRRRAPPQLLFRAAIGTVRLSGDGRLFGRPCSSPPRAAPRRSPPRPASPASPASPRAPRASPAPPRARLESSVLGSRPPIGSSRPTCLARVRHFSVAQAPLLVEGRTPRSRRVGGGGGGARPMESPRPRAPRAPPRS